MCASVTILLFFISLFQICDFIKKGAKYVWDDEQKVPYAYLGDQWVGFDDEKSIRIKVSIICTEIK